MRMAVRGVVVPDLHVAAHVVIIADMAIVGRVAAIVDRPIIDIGLHDHGAASAASAAAHDHRRRRNRARAAIARASGDHVAIAAARIAAAKAIAAHRAIAQTQSRRLHRRRGVGHGRRRHLMDHHHRAVAAAAHGGGGGDRHGARSGHGRAAKSGVEAGAADGSRHGARALRPESPARRQRLGRHQTRDASRAGRRGDGGRHGRRRRGGERRRRNRRRGNRVVNRRGGGGAHVLGDRIIRRGLLSLDAAHIERGLRRGRRSVIARAAIGQHGRRLSRSVQRLRQHARRLGQRRRRRRRHGEIRAAQRRQILDVSRVVERELVLGRSGAEDHGGRPRLKGGVQLRAMAQTKQSAVVFGTDRPGEDGKGRRQSRGRNGDPKGGAGGGLESIGHGWPLQTESLAFALCGVQKPGRLWRGENRLRMEQRRMISGNLRQISDQTLHFAPDPRRRLRKDRGDRSCDAPQARS